MPPGCSLRSTAFGSSGWPRSRVRFESMYSQGILRTGVRGLSENRPACRRDRFGGWSRCTRLIRGRSIADMRGDSAVQLQRAGRIGDGRISLRSHVVSSPTTCFSKPYVAISSSMTPSNSVPAMALPFLRYFSCWSLSEDSGTRGAVCGSETDLAPSKRSVVRRGLNGRASDFVFPFDD